MITNIYRERVKERKKEREEKRETLISDPNITQFLVFNRLNIIWKYLFLPTKKTENKLEKVYEIYIYIFFYITLEYVYI